jgi:predicted nucleic acid-binding Zn ribbon protein
MSRDFNNQPIGAIIKEWIKQRGLEKKMMRVDAITTYREVVGEFISKHTTKAEIFGKTLSVSIDSGVIKQELSMNRQNVVQQINEKMGQPIIDRLEIW